jgi:hypothetical protein
MNGKKAKMIRRLEKFGTINKEALKKSTQQERAQLQKLSRDPASIDFLRTMAEAIEAADKARAEDQESAE